ncbi:MAG: hypothetical protein WCH99_17750 [Verrucomicrobiota bacterium]
MTFADMKWIVPGLLALTCFGRAVFLLIKPTCASSLATTTMPRWKSRPAESVKSSPNTTDGRDRPTCRRAARTLVC